MVVKVKPAKIHPSKQYRSQAHTPKALRRPNVELPPHVKIDEDGVATYNPPKVKKVAEGDSAGGAGAVSPKAKKRTKTKAAVKKAKHLEKPITLGSIDR